MRRNPKILIILGLLLSVTFGIFLNRPSHPKLPQFDQAFFETLKGREMHTLEIEVEDLSKIRSLLETSKRDYSSMKWAHLGVLSLKLKGTEVSRMSIFSNGKHKEIPLEISETYYLGYDQKTFQEIIKRAKLILTKEILFN